jgi:glycosyltransferase involved in cell wall biosynthesis
MSVSRQSAPRSWFDVFIIQDGEQPGLPAIMSRFKDLSIVHVTLEHENGVSAARNLALRQSESPYVLLLDSDDRLTTDCITTFWEFITGNRGHQFYFSDAEKHNGNFRTVLRSIKSAEYMKYYARYPFSIHNPLYHSIFVDHAAVMLRDAILDIGGFDVRKPCAELTDAILRLHVAGYSIGHVPTPLYMYRDAPHGLSKHPQIHKERAHSIKRAVREVHGLELVEVAPLGRVLPYGHMHYSLTGVDRRMIIPPYVDYASMRLKAA